MKNDEIKKMPVGTLTKGEKRLICEVLRHSVQIIKNSEAIFEDMIGKECDLEPGGIFRRKDGRILYRAKFASGLEHEILDACNIDQIDRKLNVDGVELLFKIRGMTPMERGKLIQKVAVVWLSVARVIRKIKRGKMILIKPQCNYF